MSPAPVTHNNKRIRPSIVSTPASTHSPDAFPYFTKGLVSIILHPNDPKYHYKLHRAVLERNSGWFLDSMSELLPGEDISYLKSGQVGSFKYVLEQRDGEGAEEMGGWVLVRKVSNSRTSVAPRSERD